MNEVLERSNISCSRFDVKEEHYDASVDHAFIVSVKEQWEPAFPILVSEYSECWIFVDEQKSNCYQ